MQDFDVSDKIKPSQKNLDKVRNKISEATGNLEKIRQNLEFLRLAEEAPDKVVPHKLSLLSIKSQTDSVNSIILRESKLWEDISRIIGEFDKLNKRYEELHQNSSSFGEKHELSLRLLELVYWLKNALINLVDLHMENLRNSVLTEAELETDELKLLARVNHYYNFFAGMPRLFMEVFGVEGFLSQLHNLSIGVNAYNKNGLAADNILDEKLRELENELRDVDSAYGKAIFEDNKTENDSQKKTLDIIPIEVNIPCLHGTVISGDLYLQSPDAC